MGGELEAKLRSIPMLQGLSEEDLSGFAGLLAPVQVQSGDVLFDVGGPADAFYFLLAGETVLEQDGQEIYRLRPPAVIGELGAVTGLRRKCRATIVGSDPQLYAVRREDLLGAFEAHPHMGNRFLLALMAIAADKVERDQLRVEDMRANIIRTQKTMKRMRDFILESLDTVVSDKLYNHLEDLIRQNRRVNYRVEPPAILPASLRLDDGTEEPITGISRTHVSFRRDLGVPPAVDDPFVGVLLLAGPEIPVSGRVLGVTERVIDVELDLLLDEYVAVLEGYLTRAQMLDFLV